MMGFIHVMAVPGVQYLIFGKTRIAKRPVEWGYFGPWSLACT